MFMKHPIDLVFTKQQIQCSQSTQIMKHQTLDHQYCVMFTKHQRSSVHKAQHTTTITLIEDQEKH
jgi:hypothetical protein